MTRDAAVQQAREWQIERYRDSGKQFESRVEALAAYALDRLAQELGELEKEMCAGCEAGYVTFPEGDDIMHATPYRSFEGGTINWQCHSEPIRRRLAAIEQVRKEEG